MANRKGVASIARRAGERHGLADAAEIEEALRSSPTRGRIYFLDDCGHMVKVVSPALDPTTDARANDLVREAEILKLLSGVASVPQFAFLDVTSGWQALGTNYVEGANLIGRKVSRRGRARVMWSIARVVVAMSLRGLSHNDIKFENVLLSEDEQTVWLIDFDQATTGHSRWRAFVRNTIGSNFYRNEVVVHGSLRTLFRSAIRRRALARQRRMPPLSEAVTAQQKKLYEAWKLAQVSDANAPGDGVAYYALEVDGLKLPGERSWEDRWNVLRGVTSFDDKRVIELGCNMGLLSVYLRRYGKAADVWGVDHDEEILKSARLVADAFDTPAKFSLVDLMHDQVGVESLIAFNSDVITCLNVWNWVPDRSLLSRLLSSVNEIIFEGHESVETETERLEVLGFRHVRLVASTERGRPLLHGTKFA